MRVCFFYPEFFNLSAVWQLSSKTSFGVILREWRGPRDHQKYQNKKCRCNSVFHISLKTWRFFFFFFFREKLHWCATLVCNNEKTLLCCLQHCPLLKTILSHLSFSIELGCYSSDPNAWSFICLFLSSPDIVLTKESRQYIKLF